MAAYCTIDDLIAEFGAAEITELSDRDGTGSQDDARLDRAINRASIEIDGYCSTRYVIPLTAVDPEVVGIACDLARYYLFDDEVPDLVRERYQHAISVLRDIQAGRRSLAADLVSAGAGIAVPGPKRPRMSSEALDKMPAIGS